LSNKLLVQRDLVWSVSSSSSRQQQTSSLVASHALPGEKVHSILSRDNEFDAGWLGCRSCLLLNKAKARCVWLLGMEQWR